MSDGELRDAQRRWQETGSVEDEARYLHAQLRSGALDPPQLRHLALLGHPAAVLALGNDAPAPAPAWIVWYSDTFDREMPPQRELAHRSPIEEGLRELWARTLAHSVRDDGQATFTRFHLTWAAPRPEVRGGADAARSGRGDDLHGSASIPVHPFENPALARLRRWLNGDPQLPATLAAAHRRLVLRAVSEDDAMARADPLLDAVRGVESPEEVEAALAEASGAEP